MLTQRVSAGPEVQIANPVAQVANGSKARVLDPFQLKLVLSCLVLVLGAIEGWFARTDFATDAISYLDISRAIPARDWKLVFNPLWSVGYPFLLAIARSFFPATPSGEWVSIHVLNLIIFLSSWFAFLYLLASVDSFVNRRSRAENVALSAFLLLAGTAVFISIELCVDTVSRVGPDLMVSTWFFLATALLVRLVGDPSYRKALVLGLILGAGYWTKGVFLPLAFILLLVTATALLWKKHSTAPALLAFLVFAIVAAPYAAALSWSLGRFTLGESGRLNYAFHVNYLPRWTNWQGGPSGYGIPIHPTRQVMTNPSLFVFGEPYHNTYPPFGNVVYWYEGYRQFWNAKYQAIGIARNSLYLAKVLVKEPIFFAVAASTILLILTTQSRRAWLTTALGLWPFYLSALLGIALYVQVHLEDRYLGSFLAVLCLVPFLMVVALNDMPSRRVQQLVLGVMALGAILNYAIVDRAVFAHIAHHYTFKDNPQWKLGLGLQRLGFRSGDPFGAIGGPNASCTWAYIAHLRIVAELGGEPYDQHHPAEGLSGNEIQMYWHSSPERQAQILKLFHDNGAVAVIASGKPADVKVASGWQWVEGTDTWVYPLSSSR